MYIVKVLALSNDGLKPNKLYLVDTLFLYYKHKRITFSLLCTKYRVISWSLVRILIKYSLENSSFFVNVVEFSTDILTE